MDKESHLIWDIIHALIQVEVRAYTSNYIPLFCMDVITYSRTNPDNGSVNLLQQRRPPVIIL